MNWRKYHIWKNLPNMQKYNYWKWKPKRNYNQAQLDIENWGPTSWYCEYYKWRLKTIRNLTINDMLKMPINKTFQKKINQNKSTRIPNNLPAKLNQEKIL